MCEHHFVRNCAPTLAGIKTGSLFPCPFEDRSRLLGSIRSINRRLGKKGLRCIPLRFSGSKALIYVYRPSKLRGDLQNTTAKSILNQQGYCPENADGCLVRLARKLREKGEFPHEIGLFLGYPAEDVQGFMENKACGCKCCGCWKVYGDVDKAEQKFAQYKKCTRIYCRLHEEGKDIDRLTVAC